jgi:hypothetical protein
MATVPKSGPSEVAIEGYQAVSRPFGVMGKAVDLQEEMTKCTVDAAGIGVQASKERFTEIMSGRAYWQQGLVVTCKD